MSEIKIPQLEISEETDFDMVKKWYDQVFADPDYDKFRYLSYIKLTDISSSPDDISTERPHIEKLMPQDPAHFAVIMRCLVDKLQKNVCRICPNYQEYPVIGKEQLKSNLLLPKQVKENQKKLKKLIGDIRTKFKVEFSKEEKERIRNEWKKLNKKRDEIISKIDEELGHESQIELDFNDFYNIYYQLIKKNKEIEVDTLNYEFWQKYKENEIFRDLVDNLFLLYEENHILYSKYTAMDSGICIKGSKLKDMLIQAFSEDFAEELIHQVSNHISLNSQNIENEYIGNDLLRYIEQLFPKAWQSHIAPILQKELKDMRKRIVNVF